MNEYWSWMGGCKQRKNLNKMQQSLNYFTQKSSDKHCFGIKIAAETNVWTREIFSAKKRGSSRTNLLLCTFRLLIRVVFWSKRVYAAGSTTFVGLCHYTIKNNKFPAVSNSGKQTDLLPLDWPQVTIQKQLDNQMIQLSWINRGKWNSKQVPGMFILNMENCLFSGQK